MSDVVSINGQLVPPAEARVSVFDSGFAQGIGLFETMRAVRGRVFRLEQHLGRLRASAAALGWGVLPDPQAMRRNVQAVASIASGEGDARVRLTVTTGTLRQTDAETPELTMVATAAPGGRYPEEMYQRGVTATLSRYRQTRLDPTAGHKTTSYFGRLAGLREAHRAGAFEALWFNVDNELAEGCISSVFLVRDGALATPPLETPVLPGITRAAVIEIAGRIGVTVREAALTIDDLLEADEVTLTSSLMGVMPVVRIDRKAVGGEKPGEVTRALMEAYAALVEKECAGGENATGDNGR